MSTQIIRQPLITERTLILAKARNVYTFEVEPRATKAEIRQAIKAVYGVEAEKINTIRGYSYDRHTGKRRLPVSVPPVKKALVTVKQGQTISAFDFGESQTA